jgi:hypothetical protein
LALVGFGYLATGDWGLRVLMVVSGWFCLYLLVLVFVWMLVWVGVFVLGLSPSTGSDLGPGSFMDAKV